MSRKRVYHILSDNKATKAPKYVIFFDTETKEKNVSDTAKELSLKLGYAVLTRRTPGKGFKPESDCSFTTRREFIDWLLVQCRGREKYYLVAHNIGFDVRVTGVMRSLAKAGWKRTSFIMDGLNFMARYRKGDTTIFLMNNQQLFNSSLADLGASIGIPKLKVDFDTVSDADLLTYCKRDVEVMRVAWNLWYEFVSSSDLGNFRMTIGSQAMSAFRHRFMRTKIYIHTNEKVIELERESYHGGRVECFHLGKYDSSTVYNLDINAMYPYIMKEHKVPTKLIAYYEKLSVRDFSHIRKRFGYITSATLRIEKPTLPIVREGRLIFPVGEITGVFTKPELEHALLEGTLLNVSRCAVYHEERIFSSFVDFFYHARKSFAAEGKSEFAYFSKILMNSLYGKFGQKVTEYEEVGFNAKLPDHAGRTYNLFKKRDVAFRVIDGIIEEEAGTHEANDSFVAIASYITGGARAYLSELLDIAGWENVLYCDTDSIFANVEGYRRLSAYIDQGSLGKLKLEGSSDQVTIRGPKRYDFGDKKRSKGIRSNARLVGENTYAQEQFESFKGALRSGHTDSVIIRMVTKKLSDEYQKGLVQPDGRIQPFRFPVPDPATL